MITFLFIIFFFLLFIKTKQNKKCLNIKIKSRNGLRLFINEGLNKHNYKFIGRTSQVFFYECFYFKYKSLTEKKMELIEAI